jgi:hypothetical protein
MSDVTIHFDPEKADLLRRALNLELCVAADHLTSAVQDEYDPAAQGLGDAHKASVALGSAGEQARTILNLFAEIGWELGTKAKMSQITVDAEWMRDVVNSGFQGAVGDVEHGADTEKLRTALHASEFYDALWDQLPPEPAKVEA